MSISENLSKRHVGLPLTLVILYILIMVSLFYEYYLKIDPSDLYLGRRYCAIACNALVTIAFIFKGEIGRKCIDMSCVTLFWGFGLSCYHLLIQYRFLAEPSIFRKDIPFNVSTEEMDAIVAFNEKTSCTKMDPMIFEIPTSAFALVTFTFLFIYLSYCFKTEEGQKKPIDSK